MVIIVISIMGGFLDLVRGAGRTLMGDVTVFAPGMAGFPHYGEMIEEIQKLPEAQAATPLTTGYGLIKLPPFGNVKPVQVVGIDGHGLDRVTGFRGTLFWTPQRLKEPRYEVIDEYYAGADPLDAATNMAPPWDDAKSVKLPAIVPGLEINPANRRNPDGSYSFDYSLIHQPVVVTILPITLKGGIAEPATGRFVVVNEFNSGVYEVDDKRVYIPFDVAQKMMNMSAAARLVRGADGQPRFNPDGTFKTEGVEPARASEVHIRAKPGVTSDQLRDAVLTLLDKDFSRKYPNMPRLAVETWEARQANFLGAVQNEKNLMTFLFGIISVVAILMVAVVFYAIVTEKTRDIGVLRALGASPSGVASIFLSFGLVIGTLGAGLGVLIAYLIVHNINDIHTWLGKGFGAMVLLVGVPLGVAILYAILGAAHASVQRVFDVGRTATTIRVSSIGAVVTGAAGVAACLLLAGRQSRFDEFLAGISINPTLAMAAFVVGLALIPVLVDLQYALLDRFKGGKKRYKVLGFTLQGAVLAAIGVGIKILAGDHVLADMNRSLGFQIWDRRVYFFDHIPNRLDWTEVGIIGGVAIVSSILGALIPALMAAMMDPVETLRYE